MNKIKVTKLNKAELLEMAEQIGRDNAWDTYPGRDNDLLWAWNYYVWISAATWLEDVRTPAEIRGGARYHLDVTATEATRQAVETEITKQSREFYAGARKAALEGSEKEARLLRSMGWDGR